MAFEIEYSDNCGRIRAVESADRFIRKEAFINGVWQTVGKPYVVAKNKQRAAEQIKAEALAFLAA